MTSIVEPWPEDFGVEVATVAAWIERTVSGPVEFVRVLRNKLWGFTALFTAARREVVVKVAAPPLFPDAAKVHTAAHAVAPEAVPELLAWGDRGAQHWSLFANVGGVDARGSGAEAVLGTAEVVAAIQAAIALDLPPNLPTVPAASVATLLSDLEDLPVELVTELDERRVQLLTWGQELDTLVPLSLDHVDLHLENVLRTLEGRFVVLDWEEAVISCPLFSFNRLRIDAVDHGIAGLAERLYLQRLLPTLEVTQQRRAMELANVLAPLKLAHEARRFAADLGWSNRHTRLTIRYVTEALEAASSLTGHHRPRPPHRLTSSVTVSVHERGAGKACSDILGTLPDWFGIAEANEEYVAAAESARTLVAAVDGEAVGVLVPRRHSDNAAEIYLLAVAAPHRRNGIGRALVETAERLLADDGVSFLQVKTLSARRRDDGYEETRAFYRSLGFVHLEEHPTMWDPANPALQLVKHIASGTP